MLNKYPGEGRKKETNESKHDAQCLSFRSVLLMRRRWKGRERTVNAHQTPQKETDHEDVDGARDGSQRWEGATGVNRPPRSAPKLKEG